MLNKDVPIWNGSEMYMQVCKCLMIMTNLFFFCKYYFRVIFLFFFVCFPFTFPYDLKCKYLVDWRKTDKVSESNLPSIISYFLAIFFSQFLLLVAVWFHSFFLLSACLHFMSEIHFLSNDSQ